MASEQYASSTALALADDSARNAVTLRMSQGEVLVFDGPYAETKEVLGGILLLEARDLQHAATLMSKHPRLKMGPFEIRPADEAITRLCAERAAAIAQKARSGKNRRDVKSAALA